MSDQKTVRDDAPKTPPHPAGQFASACVDVIDLGLNVESFQGQPSELKDKTALVFITEEKRDGKNLTIAQEFTTSLGKKSNMRKFLESWRGKPYTEDEAKKQGIPLDKLEGVPALLSIAHKTSSGGNEYAYIVTVSPLPKAMRETAPARDGYARAEWWGKRKSEYQARAEKYMAEHPQVPRSETSEPEPEVQGEDDDLPF